MKKNIYNKKSSFKIQGSVPLIQKELKLVELFLGERSRP